MREPGYYWVRGAVGNPSGITRTPFIAEWFAGKGKWVFADGEDVADWTTDADFDFISPERLIPPEMPAKE